ncbi:MAG TPA: hypothetical protein VFF04_05400 [Candidatus Babeliales bacterium]|nr:hypothetical protein [Candidatus Babeliales bacterium]
MHISAKLAFCLLFFNIFTPIVASERKTAKSTPLLKKVLTDRMVLFTPIAFERRLSIPTQQAGAGCVSVSPTTPTHFDLRGTILGDELANRLKKCSISPETVKAFNSFINTEKNQSSLETFKSKLSSFENEQLDEILTRHEILFEQEVDYDALRNFCRPTALVRRASAASPSPVSSH